QLAEAPVCGSQGGFLLERAEVAGRGDGALIHGYGRVALTRPLVGAAQQAQPADCTPVPVVPRAVVPNRLLNPALGNGGPRRRAARPAPSPGATGPPPRPAGRAPGRARPDLPRRSPARWGPARSVPGPGSRPPRCRTPGAPTSGRRA